MCLILFYIANRIQQMVFSDNFYLMIARSLALSSEKARLIENRTSNLTSSKQKDALKHFQEDCYIPNDHLFEVTEKVDMENTIANGKDLINNESVTMPRRPMSKQIEMWNHLNHETPRLKVVTDGYYHETIAVTTNNFLENMRQFIIDCEEKIRKKRKQLVNDTTMAIRKEWEDIRLCLMNDIHNWCKRSEEEEIAIFLEKGEVFATGALAELATRLANKRQEIDIYFSRIVGLYKDNQILREEEITRHMFTVKNLLKEIWDKHYEFEVHQLDLNVNTLIEGIQSLPYEFEESSFMRDALHRSIDDTLSQFSIFKPYFESFLRREQQKAANNNIRKGEGSLRKNSNSVELQRMRQRQRIRQLQHQLQRQQQRLRQLQKERQRQMNRQRLTQVIPQVRYIQVSPERPARDVVVDSFICDTMKSLQALRAERDREWLELTSKVQK